MQHQYSGVLAHRCKLKNENFGFDLFFTFIIMLMLPATLLTTIVLRGDGSGGGFPFPYDWSKFPTGVLHGEKQSVMSGVSLPTSASLHYARSLFVHSYCIMHVPVLFITLILQRGSLPMLQTGKAKASWPRLANTPWPYLAGNTSLPPRSGRLSCTPRSSRPV